MRRVGGGAVPYMAGQVTGALIVSGPRNRDRGMAVVCNISTACSSLGLEDIRIAGININNLSILDGNSWGHLEVLVDWRGPGRHLPPCRKGDQDS